LRLQKFLSRAGVASRRQAERLIEAGRVAVDGAVVTELGTRVDPNDCRVAVDGVPVALESPVWVMLHKTTGTLTSRGDPHGGATVYDALPERFHALPYVGRLDRETEGLLLFTNAGDTAHALLHPSSQVEREYEVWVAGTLEDSQIRSLLAGVELEDGPARAVRAVRPSSGADRPDVRLVVVEGRKREVRRMLKAVRAPVRRLRRIRFGPLRLDPALKPGEYRELTEAEVLALRTRASA